MPENKSKVAITIDPDLLQRIDAVADLRGQSRSSVIERIIRNEIEAEEEFVEDMDSPVMQTILGVILNTPGVTETIARVVGNNMNKEQLAEMKKGLKEQVARGKERTAKSKVKPSIA